MHRGHGVGAVTAEGLIELGDAVENIIVGREENRLPERGRLEVLYEGEMRVRGSG